MQDQLCYAKVMRPSDKLNWDDLKLVLALAETGYVNQAAERLRLDPTTLPRRLRRIEKSLGVKLIERVKGGVVLAPVADELVETARMVEEAVNQTLSADEATDEVFGMVKVSATDFMFELLAPEFASLLSVHPGLQLDMRPGNTYLSIDKRETDVAIRLGGSPTEGLVGRRLAAIQTAVYGTEPKRLTKDGSSWLSWNFPRGLVANDAFINTIDPNGRVVARVDSMITQAKFVDTGAGLARLPVAFVEARSDLAGLKRLADAPPVEAWVVTHEELRNVPRINVVMQAVAEAFGRFSCKLADL
ncbi:MAG: LysR family transcriptional regulator [Pseudomonadota bacterium]